MARPLGIDEATRARRLGLQPGMRLHHKRKGGDMLTCVYEGPGNWVFDGVHYPSGSAAANAALQKTGSKALKTVSNGWKFWRMDDDASHREGERREERRESGVGEDTGAREIVLRLRLGGRRVEDRILANTLINSIEQLKKLLSPHN